MLSNDITGSYFVNYTADIVVFSSGRALEITFPQPPDLLSSGDDDETSRLFGNYPSPFDNENNSNNQYDCFYPFNYCTPVRNILLVTSLRP